MSDEQKQRTFTAAFKAYTTVEEHRLFLEDFTHEVVNATRKINCTHVVGTGCHDLRRSCYDRSSSSHAHQLTRMDTVVAGECGPRIPHGPCTPYAHIAYCTPFCTTYCILYIHPAHMQDYRIYRMSAYAARARLTYPRPPRFVCCCRYSGNCCLAIDLWVSWLTISYCIPSVMLSHTVALPKSLSKQHFGAPCTGHLYCVWHCRGG